VIRPDWAYGLSLEERLLSNSFQESGYATAILGKWHLGMFTPDYLPTRRGFDFQYGNYCGAIDCFTKMRQGGYDWHRNDKVAREEGYSTEQLAEEAVAWVNSLEKGKPFLMYVPFNAVHAPLQAPERYRTQFANIKGSRGQYAAMLSAVDEAIGKVRLINCVVAIALSTFFRRTMVGLRRVRRPVTGHSEQVKERFTKVECDRVLSCHGKDTSRPGRISANRFMSSISFLRSRELLEST
jgi:arylsulfatase A-like enzyme